MEVIIAYRNPAVINLCSCSNEKHASLLAAKRRTSLFLALTCEAVEQLPIYAPFGSG